MTVRYNITQAVPSDVETLVTFTREEAREAEGLIADPVAITRGIEATFADSPRSTYWIAEDETGAAVASTSVIKEWSDFHGGDYWWFQSVFITPPHRGSGLLALLIDHLATTAELAHALDLRLSDVNAA